MMIAGRATTYYKEIIAYIEMAQKLPVVVASMPNSTCP
jgi:hypothetical protein